VWAGETVDQHVPGSAADEPMHWHVEDGNESGYRARPGQRPGGFADRPTRSGGREDVMAPVPVLPGTASRALHSGAVFDQPIPGFEINLRSLHIDEGGSTWKASVIHDRPLIGRRRRAATLRAYPSPSSNLTILELVPTRPTIIQTWAFVRVGVTVIEALSRRLLSTSRSGSAVKAEPLSIG
jgi:hypothetical protein